MDAAKDHLALKILWLFWMVPGRLVDVNLEKERKLLNT